jgi:hypothetical protein
MIGALREIWWSRWWPLLFTPSANDNGKGLPSHLAEQLGLWGRT